MSANERRRAIIEAMCERRYDTRENLAFEFGVSKRTIENDVLMLTREYPIYTSKGNGGGIYVMEGYRLDRKYLSEEQTELLKRLSAGLTEGDAKVMESILKTFSLKKHQKKEVKKW